MRFLIAALLAIWTILTAFAYIAVLPQEKRGNEVLNAAIDAYALAEQGEPAPAAETLRQHAADFRQRVQQQLGAQPPADLRDIATLPDEQQSTLRKILAQHLNQTHDTPLQDTPVLVWSTDDNPARDTQAHLFRVWHFLNYAEPIDLTTDPSNRDITKAIVQCVAGAGPDLIESYGPEQLRQFVESGVALDVTEQARSMGFTLERAFAAARPSMGIKDPATQQWTQYAFPCNVGYTVLFYHQDLFENAGIPKPEDP